ncbi:hypothetical protein [Streptomyces sp. NPDC001269]
MSTVIYTRHLVEHRYGRPLEDLQRDGAHGDSGDPVLSIVLRRLGNLAETNAHARAARRNLDAAWQRCRSGKHAPDDLVLRYAAEIPRHPRQQQPARHGAPPSTRRAQPSLIRAPTPDSPFVITEFPPCSPLYNPEPPRSAPPTRSASRTRCL